MLARLLLAALTLTGCKSSSVLLYIDNGRDAPASIVVDGRETIKVGAYDIGQFHVTNETHDVVARSLDGTTIDQVKLSGDANESWVFNVSGANEYARREVHYCTRTTLFLCKQLPPLPFRTTGSLVKMPHAFMTVLPETRTSNTKVVTANVVEHYYFHPDRPCCQRLRRPPPAAEPQ
jgi:hypothetical protein